MQRTRFESPPKLSRTIGNIDSSLFLFSLSIANVLKQINLDWGQIKPFYMTIFPPPPLKQDYNNFIFSYIKTAQNLQKKYVKVLNSQEPKYIGFNPTHIFKLSENKHQLQSDLNGTVITNGIQYLWDEIDKVAVLLCCNRKTENHGMAKRHIFYCGKWTHGPEPTFSEACSVLIHTSHMQFIWKRIRFNQTSTAPSFKFKIHI